MNHFFDNHWFTGFVLGLSIVNGAVQIANRIIRHRNIRSAGWPPAHLDADGDFLKEDE